MYVSTIIAMFITGTNLLKLFLMADDFCDIFNGMLRKVAVGLCTRCVGRCPLNISALGIVGMMIRKYYPNNFKKDRYGT